tara:strand:+ start:78 stop:566 length:489 start_codon:yes stop_codon:yes gene_type:complete
MTLALLLTTRLLSYALAVLAPGFALFNTLSAILLLLGAVVRPLVLFVALLIGALLLRPGVMVFVVGLVLLRIFWLLVLIWPLLMLPWLLILVAWVIVILAHLMRLGIYPRRLAVGLAVRLLHDNHPGLRLIGLRVMRIYALIVPTMVHNRLGAGIGIIRAGT